jgi:hypothetical protein
MAADLAGPDGEKNMLVYFSGLICGVPTAPVT